MAVAKLPILSVFYNATNHCNKAKFCKIDKQNGGRRIKRKKLFNIKSYQKSPLGGYVTMCGRILTYVCSIELWSVLLRNHPNNYLWWFYVTFLGIGIRNSAVLVFTNHLPKSKPRLPIKFPTAKHHTPPFLQEKSFS